MDATAIDSLDGAIQRETNSRCRGSFTALFRLALGLWKRGEVIPQQAVSENVAAADLPQDKEILCFVKEGDVAEWRGPAEYSGTGDRELVKILVAWFFNGGASAIRDEIWTGSQDGRSEAAGRRGSRRRVYTKGRKIF